MKQLKNMTQEELVKWRRLDRETKWAPGNKGRDGWRAIPRYPGCWINKQGDVWFAGLPWGAKLRSETAIRPQWTNHYGYKVVGLSCGHGSETFLVHRLVLYTFVGPCPTGMQVDHVNGIRSDNRLENLEYVTPLENSRRMWARRRAA